MVVQLHALRFRWRPDLPLVIDLPELHLARRESLFLRGPSGSGKSTLLALIGGVLTPESGRIELLGEDLAAMGGARRDHWRADHVGFVFQQFNLVPYLDVVENVLLPCRFSARRRTAAGADPRAEALRLLAHLQLGEDAIGARDVTELSVGQQQRVAVARALIDRPALVIADEPTSALDTDARDAFLDLLETECRAADAALLFVSHDRSLARRFSRQLDLPSLNRRSQPGG
ncbi:MAG: ABC transporter ATP-binding protein [Pseudomonadales bacterium]|jgi:putative ABC transport system ATP-binding protein|nr:ABC transporter ATP-binding protein [Pseudomonadales bacterium]